MEKNSSKQKASETAVAKQAPAEKLYLVTQTVANDILTRLADIPFKWSSPVIQLITTTFQEFVPDVPKEENKEEKQA